MTRYLDAITATLQAVELDGCRQRSEVRFSYDHLGMLRPPDVALDVVVSLAHPFRISRIVRAIGFLHLARHLARLALDGYLNIMWRLVEEVIQFVAHLMHQSVALDVPRLIEASDTESIVFRAHFFLCECQLTAFRFNHLPANHQFDGTAEY